MCGISRKLKLLLLLTLLT